MWVCDMTCEEMLADAKAKLHQVEVYGATVSISEGDRQKVYRPATLASLRMYVDRLDKQCGVQFEVNGGTRYGRAHTLEIC